MLGVHLKLSGRIFLNSLHILRKNASIAYLIIGKFTQAHSIHHKDFSNEPKPAKKALEAAKS